MKIPIHAENLHYAYGSELVATNVSFEVRSGRIVGLLGPDGAGKTTVMRLLAGLLRPLSGTTEITGIDVSAHPEAARAQLGYLPQRFGLAEDLTVDENLRFVADIRSVPRSRRGKLADELREFAGLGPFGSRLAGALSGGMKQKLGLAAALVHRPAVLILDEPTNGIDPVSRRDFWRSLGRLCAQGTAVLISTPYLDEAERCNEAIFLDRGRVTAHGTVDELRRRVGGGVVVMSLPPKDAAAAAKVTRADALGAIAVGGSLRVHHRNPESAVSSIHYRLSEAGITAGETRIEPPSLEEIFMAVRGGDQVG
jgi:ABC-2 type transport system ATP-binding protein